MRRQEGLGRDCPLGRVTAESGGSRVFSLCHFLGLKTSLNTEKQIVP